MSEPRTEFIPTGEFVDYFTARGLTVVEAVSLWDELGDAGGDDPDNPAPVTCTRDGVTYELAFDYPANSGSAVVVVTARPAGAR